MGYRSQVRSLIYGEPDKICALYAAQALTGGKVFSDYFADELKRYRIDRDVYGEDGQRTIEVEVIDYTGDSVKWYAGYHDVQAWEQLLSDAAEMGLCTEFIRVGEEHDDIECRFRVDDGGDHYLSTSTSITDEVPEGRPVDYTQAEAA